MKEINIDIIHDELFKQTPELSFNNCKDYDSWKAKIKEMFIDLLGINEIKKNECPLNIEIEYQKEEDDYYLTRYTFYSEKNSPVPAYLLIPKLNKKKYPVCICLQGHTTGFHMSIGKTKYDIDNTWLNTHAFALYAVKRGFAALAIEQRGMGERTTPFENRGRALTCGCYNTAFTALLLGRTLIGERAWDVSKAIDSLDYFKENLDLEDITILGSSGGGTASYYAAAFDQRIKYAVPACAICTYKDSIAALWHCSCNYIPRISKYIDMGEIAALIAPRKLLICHGEDDPIFPLKGTLEVYSTIEKIYEKENAKDNVKLLIYPHTPHAFNEDMTFDALLELRK